MEGIHSRPVLTRTSKNNALKNVAVAKKSSTQTAGPRAALGEISNQRSQLNEVSQKGLKSKIGQKTAKVLKSTTSQNELDDFEDLCRQFENCFKPENDDVEDIDEGDDGRTQLCSNYAKPIYQYKFSLENKNKIMRDYLAGTHLKPKMRCILVDWLIQVHHRFQLMQETLYLSIIILDRFLQSCPVEKNQLQLHGVTALHIASKYEEMYAPEINDYVFVSDDSFTREEIMKAEINMLKVLEFNLGSPLPLHFLRRCSKAGNVDPLHHFMGKYLLELSVVDYKLCHVKGSKRAAAALWLSLKLLNGGSWTNTLAYYSFYKEEEIYPVVCHLARILLDANSIYSRFIQNKYNTSRLNRISKHSCLTQMNDYLEALAAECDDDI